MIINLQIWIPNPEEEFDPSTAVVVTVVSCSRLDGDNGDHNVTALLQLQSLTGDNFLEKERRLSEMILQLQMVREQLLSQQEQQSKVSITNNTYTSLSMFSVSFQVNTTPFVRFQLWFKLVHSTRQLWLFSVFTGLILFYPVDWVPEFSKWYGYRTSYHPKC